MQTQEEQEEHTMIQHETMRLVGEELMVPRVPRLHPEPSARQIAEHELTGHAEYRRWCRHSVASKVQAHAHASREEGELPDIGIDCGFFGRDTEDVPNVETVQADAWQRQLLTGKVRQTM